MRRRPALILVVLAGFAAACVQRLGFDPRPDPCEPSIEYRRADLTFLVGADNYARPSVVGDLDEFAIDPALPSGVTIDTATGAISGRPAQIHPATHYQVSGRSGRAETSTAITLAAWEGFEVNDAADIDEAPADIGDGVCGSTADTCTLRAAFSEAEALAGPQMIRLPAGGYGLGAGSIRPTSDLLVQGVGRGATVIDAAATSRHFTVEAPITLHLDGLVLRNGEAGGNGGAVLVAGGGRVEAFDVWFDGNAVTGAGSSGGAVFVGDSSDSGAFIADRCEFTNNEAARRGGAVGVLAGAGTRITRSVFSGNEASEAAGAVWLVSGLVEVTQSFFVNNRVTNSTSTGGAIYSQAGAEQLFSNCTFLFNEAGRGGAVAVGNTAAVDLEHVTVVQNRTTDTIGGVWGALDAFNDGVLTVTNSVVARNLSEPHNREHADCRTSDNGVIRSGGGNVSAGCTTSFSDATDITGVDPYVLGAGVNAGGLTDTLPLMPRSLAIGHALPARCPPVDQRGAPRDPNRCDSGAYQTGDGPPPRSFGYSRSWWVVMHDREAPPLEPSVIGEAQCYSSWPALPPGLNLDWRTGVIDGRPTHMPWSVELQVEARSAGGRSGAGLVIRVLDGYVVDSGLDEPGEPGAASCRSTPSGVCTVEAAIDLANATPNEQMIVVPAGAYRISDVAITDSVVVMGAGPFATVLDAAGARGLHTGGQSPTIWLGGLAVENAVAADGAGLFMGPSSVALLSHCRFENNEATGIGINDGGGAIKVNGFGNEVFGVEWSSFIGNRALTPDGGGALNLGGVEVAIIIASEFRENDATMGGAIRLQSTNAVAINAAFVDNDGSTGGAALAALSSGVFFTNITFFGNSGSLGAVAMENGAVAVLIGVTAVSNSSRALGAGAVTLGNGEVLILGNSAFEDNRQADGTVRTCSTFGGSSQIVSMGHNVLDDDTCGRGPGDLRNTAARFTTGGPVNAGGPTSVILPQSDSPAIGAGALRACPPFDQRGVPRPHDFDGDGRARCDSGAVELP